MFRFLYILMQFTCWVSHWCRALLCAFLVFASCAPFAVMHVLSLLLIRPFSIYLYNRLDCWQYGTYQKLGLFCFQYLSRAKVFEDSCFLRNIGDIPLLVGNTKTLMEVAMRKSYECLVLEVKTTVNCTVRVAFVGAYE
jgi:hypothetical protein